MKAPTSSLSVIVVLLAISNALNAAPAPQQQPAAGAAPTAAPTTQPPPRRQLAVPPGFKQITINGRNLLVEPTDEAWVTTALAKVQATTKPATLPATLLQKLTSQRDTILRQIAVDLALKDLTAAARTYDLELVAPIRSLDTLKPPVFYLVATSDRIADAMKAGWTDPHFYYNRAADAVSFNPSGVLTADRPMDDVVFPAVYNPADTPEKKGETLTVQITSTEASIAASIEMRSRQLVGATFASIIQSEGSNPLNLKEDQAWFGIGLASILSAKYGAAITGAPRDELAKMLTFEHPQNPLKTTAIDLLKPTDLKTMREEVLPAYFDTVRRKSGRAIQALIDQGGGDAAIPKALTAVRDKKPADGPAMVKVIKDATGVDLTPQLVRGS